MSYGDLAKKKSTLDMNHDL